MRRSLVAALVAVALAGCTFVYSSDNAYENRTSGSSTEGDSGASSGSGSSASSAGTSSGGTSSSSNGSSNSTGSSSSSTAGSGTTASSSASTGTSGTGSSGSSGTSGATGLQRVLSNSAAPGVWMTLASDGPDAVVLAAYDSASPSGPWITSVDASGTRGPLVSATCGANTFPRAVSIGPSHAAVVGDDGASGELSVCVQGVPGFGAITHAHPLPVTAAGREVVDGAQYDGLDHFITRTDGGAPLLWTFELGDGGSSSAPLQLDGLDPRQLVADPSGSGAFVLGVSASGPPASAVFAVGGAGSSLALDAGAVALRSFDIDPDSSTAYLGGADDAGAIIVSAAVTGGNWSSLGTQRALGSEVASISARNGNLAYLYVLADGGVGVYRSVGPGADGSSEALSGGVVATAHAGRQIAITASGAVLVITDQGAWFWPYP